MSPKSSRQYRHLQAFVLLCLADGPLHGGAIHSALQEKIPGFKVDTGAVYRTLQALSKEGELEFSWDTEGAGPARKIYRLNQAGVKKLALWKEDIEHRLSILGSFLKSYEALRPKLEAQ